MIETVERVLHEQGNEALLKAIEQGRWVLRDTDGHLSLLSPLLAASLAEWSKVGPPSSAGEPWGEMVAGTWRIGIAAAVRIGAEKDGVVLRDDAAQRFLYGRAARGADIQALRTRHQPEGRVFVCDRHGDVLGLAFLSQGPKGSELRPIIDLGWYLREGG